MQTTTIKIKGMTCMGCANNVKTVLEKFPGVGRVEVSLEQAQATIQYDPTKADLDQLKEIIIDTGFEVIN